MKKSRIVLVALAVLMVFVAVSCKEPHVHEFGDWKVTEAATCTEAGVETRVCECGEKETREIKATGHVFDQKVVAEKYLSALATTESPAKYFFSCKCGEKGEETFESGDPLHNHSFSEEWKADDENHWHECECGEKAGVESHNVTTAKHNSEKHWNECSVCARKFFETEHVYGTPTVNDEGKVVHFCKCGYSEEVKGSVAVGNEAGLKKAIEDGVANIYLSADVDVSDTIIVGGEKKIVLNLNGKSLYNEADIWVNDETTNAWSLISVRENAELTIKGNGSIKAKENDVYAIDLMDEEAKVVIEDGTFVGNMHCVYVFEGSLTVNGGSYSVQQKFSNEQPYEFVLNCYDPNYQQKNLGDREFTGVATIVVTGGTFANFNPADCEAEGKGTSFLADGYKTTSEEIEGITWWTVEKN